MQRNFQARKLELGECGIRCPSLRLNPTARPRLIEIINNLNDRIQEAKLNGWLGEVQGLETSLKAAAQKLVSLDRTRDRTTNHNMKITDLGIPTIRQTPR